MMVKILAILELTVKKVKEPAFSLLFVIAALVGYSVSEMGTLAFTGEQDVLFGLISLEQGAPLLIGFVVILFMTLIVAIFEGATDIPKDINSRMILLILSKPVKRVEYLLGKYLGVVMICLIFFLIAAVTAYVTHLVKTGELFAFSVIARQFILTLVIFPFVAMTMVISAYLSDISAMIVTVIYVILSACISAFSVLIDMLPKSLEVVSIIHTITYLFPNYFYFFSSFRYGGIVIIALSAYAFSTTVIFLSIAAFRLNHRDMI
ncbi:MAG: ABC-2 transporter permease [Victivallaceae bacterium]|nr:ABC-2 transporter permease [Victivallaceae bacterium]